MAEQEISIKIKPDGTVDIDLIGYKGNACEEDMKKITKALGLVQKSKKKADYYDENKVRINAE